MKASVANGTFDAVHAGMHYTAPSGRTYWFADADYFLRTGDTDLTSHHFLILEDVPAHNASHHSTNTTEGGAYGSDIYQTVLPTYQSELETDFGSGTILPVKVLLSNAADSTGPTSWAWQSLNSMIPNMAMMFGHSNTYSGSSKTMYNEGNRNRQLSVCQNLPESINERVNYWLDDPMSAAYFAVVGDDGYVVNVKASNTYEVRRAFLWKGNA